jgi:uncharacterized RDD family membrane protein YckC
MYCPNCGQAVRYNSASQSIPSELDNLVRDREAQEHWIQRLVAFIIDAIIVGLAVFLLEFIVLLAIVIPALAFSLASFPFASFSLSFVGWLGSLALVFYFTFAEWFYGKSIGKAIFHLRVVTTDGSRLDFGKAFIRNISKIYWLLLLIDALVGLISKTKRGQKYSDYIASTNVIRQEEAPPHQAKRVSDQTAST